MGSNYYHKAVVVATVGIFYTAIDNYVYVNLGWQLLEAPKHWMLLLCLVSLPILITHMTTGKRFDLPVTIWCFGFALLTVVWFVPSSQSDMAWQEVRWRFVAIIQLLTFLMIFREPGSARFARKTLVVAVLFGVALNIYEVFVPLSFSHVIGRSAGLYVNPNMAGEALVLGMILSVTFLAPRYRVPFVLLTGIGILSTFSRAAILTWVIAVAGLILLGRLSVRHIVTSSVVCLLLATFVLLPRWDQLLTTWERTGVLNINVLQRIEWLTNPVGVVDLSRWEREYVAKQAWDKIAESPFIGSGTGSSRGAYTETHNTHLAFMQDHGLIGVLILPLFLFAATWRARGETRSVAIVFGCVIVVLSFFTHELFHTGYNFIVLSLMAAMSRDEGTQRTVIMEKKESVAARVLARA